VCSGKPADICVEQIRVLSKERLGDKLGSLTESEAGELRELLSEIYCEP
jgi:mRNA-degrading endonuclease toxin of MazEF toxin-antitoxin module